MRLGMGILKRASKGTATADEISEQWNYKRRLLQVHPLILILTRWHDE